MLDVKLASIFVEVPPNIHRKRIFTSGPPVPHLLPCSSIDWTTVLGIGGGSHQEAGGQTGGLTGHFQSGSIPDMTCSDPDLDRLGRLWLPGINYTMTSGCQESMNLGLKIPGINDTGIQDPRNPCHPP